MSAGASASLLNLSGISKRYPGVQALSDVDLVLRSGEVHALVGENGAGKSTLSKIICGLEMADSGTMKLRDNAYLPQGKRQAEEHGIRMVMQELNLVPTLSVAENIFLSNMPARWGILDRKQLESSSRKLIGKVGLKGVDPGTPVSELGIGQRQMVEIAAGLSRHCNLLILDEPTAALTNTERDLLFENIRRLRMDGVCIVYISHRMEEILQVSDRITVLRDGIVRGVLTTQDTTISEVIRLMVGRDMEESLPADARSTGACALRVRNLCRGNKVRNVSFDLFRGEILGFAGMMGSGRTELLRLIFGADQLDRGEVYVDSAGTPLRLRAPGDAVRAGIALLTEDRKEQGLLLPLPVRMNTSLAGMSAVSDFGWIDRAVENEVATALVKRLSIKCHSVDQSVGTLSGGNQQKVVMAKWLHRNPGVLMFDEPTRGIDVGAKFEIYNLLRELAGQGCAIIMVSSDMLELFAVCDRLAVMSNGLLARIFKRGEWAEDTVLEAALSGYVATNG